jgi:RimJ/RimL family protein N-acetyltransferase
LAIHQNSFGQPIGFPVADWKECAFPPRTTMYGKWCNIEILNPEKHAEELFGAYVKNRNDPDWTYLPYGPFDCFEDYQEYLKTNCSGDDPLFHVIIDADTKKAIGVASFLRVRPDIGVLEIGHIHFSPLLQKTAVATEAMFLMVKRVFEELGYRRYEWKCDALNLGSRKAAERFGFSFEGIFRQDRIYKGRSRDTAWYSTIDQDWPILKKTFEAWLSADNFDKNGRQKKRLQEIRKIIN